MINKVILMGRLTADPELKTTQSGISSCRFSVAVDRGYKDKQTGEKQTDFINIVAWRQTAEFVCKYFSKGKMIAVIGDLRNNNYTDNNGVKHYSMDVNAESVSFCGDSGSSQNGQAVASHGVQNTPAQAVTTTTGEDISLGGLDEFEEILSDGEVPF